MARTQLTQINYPGLKIGSCNTAGSAFSMAAGHLHFVRWVCPIDCTVSRMSIFKAAQAVGIKSVMGIYSNVSNQPGLKLGQSSEHTNALVNGFASTVGGPTMYDLQAPITLVKGEVYWLAYYQDTTANIEVSFSSNTNGLYVHYVTTYNSTMPASVVGVGFTSPSGGFSSMGAY